LNQEQENHRVKLAVITTHPIQYNAPLFRLLALSNWMEVKVFYTWSQAKEEIYDVDFKMDRSWDIDLLQGYDYTFVSNVAKVPGSHHHTGIINPTLTQEVAQWGAEALLVFGWNFSSHLSTLRYFKGKIPIFFRGDSTLLDEPAGFSLKKIIRRVALKWVYRHIDFALCVGAANKQYWLAHGLKTSQLIHAPHAVEITRFAEDDLEKNLRAIAWRNELGMAADEIVYLFAGKLSKKKNPEILIEAFRQIRNKGMGKVKLVIAGNGELEEDLKNKYVSDPDIRFIGFQNQSVMPVLYRLGDVFVLPSKGPGETWGLAVNEAMACKRAVLVSTQCGCAFDLVQEKVNGFLFSSDNIADLATKLLLMMNKSKLQEMGHESFIKVQDWSYDRIRLNLETALMEFGKK
jgi:glycosyltransferase involved in cell wall biosynthesis